MSTVKSLNVRQQSFVGLEQRESANGHRAAVVWFTGLSASGKTTTAYAVERTLFLEGRQVCTLDGDNLRLGLSEDLGFSPADRAEHLRRVGEVARLTYDAGLIVLCAFVSPTRASRRRVRRLLPPGRFLEVYCRCPIEVCRQRDRKRFYARADRGEIEQFAGISAAYEEPEHPELVLDTAVDPPEVCAARVRSPLGERGILPAMPWG